TSLDRMRDARGCVPCSSACSTKAATMRGRWTRSWSRRREPRPSGRSATSSRRRSPECRSQDPLPRDEPLRASRREERSLPRGLRRRGGALAARLQAGFAREGARPAALRVIHHDLPETLPMTHQSVSRTELTPVSFLERTAYVFPDRIAVIHGERRYTYREFAKRVNRLASALRGAGMNRHDRVAFLCPNIPAMLEAHYGVPAAGGILVAINTRLGSDEIGYILGPSGARFLFVDAELEPLVKPLDLTRLTVVRVDDTGGAGDPYEDFLAGGSPGPVESVLENEEETISINYTSGTTGRPKGVMYTYRG